MMSSTFPALVASLLDPGNNGFDISDALEVCLTIGAIYGALVIIAKAVRWIDARRDKAHRVDIESIMQPHLDALREQMVDLTLPIQPTSNGGLSMTDLHTKVDEALVAVHENGQATARVEARMDGIEATQLAIINERERLLNAADKTVDTLAEAVGQLGVEVDVAPLSTRPDSQSGSQS